MSGNGGTSARQAGPGPSPASVRTLSVTVGVSGAVLGGAALGGPWWLAALLTGGAAVGAVFDRQVHQLQVFGTIALTVGAALVGPVMIVPLLAAALVVSIEAAAVADRANLARPRPAWDLPPVTIGVAALVGATVLVLVGEAVGSAGGTMAVVVGAVAATVGFRALTR